MKTFAVLLLFASLTACERGPVRYQGYVEGEYARIGTPLGGRLLELSVQRGATVAAGAPLFVVERSREQAAVEEAEQNLAQVQARYADLGKGKRSEEIATIRAQRAQAVAEATLAERQLQRAQELHSEQSISREALDTAKAQNDKSKARIRELDATLATAGLAARSDALVAAEAEIKAAAAKLAQARWAFDEKAPKAPKAALVTEVFFRTGEWVGPGVPVVELLPPENRLLRFFVPEPVLSQIKPGGKVSASCDGCPGPVEATITFISPNAEFTPPVIYSRDQRSRLVYRVEAKPSADAAQLAPGLPVDVELVDGG